MFTLALEDVFRKLNWEEKAFKINECHPQLAGDVVLIPSDLEELKQMLQNLIKE